MPVIGPDYNRKQADQAVEDVLLLLKEKYKIRAFEPYWPSPHLREQDDIALTNVIHSLFMHDAWESW